MILKLLLLPFRVVFAILRFFFYPWYVRWIFRMHWAVYFALAAGIGYLAYQQYEEFRFNMLEAQWQVEDGQPEATPLSKWNAAADVASYDEVTVEGLYFAALPQGRFDPTGLERSFILLADDQGREVKAALVVLPRELAQLQQQLTAQGSGDQIAVTVNGTYNRRSEWTNSIEANLIRMGVPRTTELVVIEPFLGNRTSAIYDRAEKTFGTVTVFGGLAGLLALIGIVKFITVLGAQRKSSSHQSQRSGREVQAARQKKQPTQKAVPIGGAAPEASPWGSFKPQPRNGGQSTPSNQLVKPQTNAQVIGTRKTAPPRAQKVSDLPEEPAFKSVFPGGGSSFRFKSAEEIIRQAFGTLSALKPSKRGN